MTAEKLFLDLDLDRDGFLSRDELHEAARSLGWGWRFAPFLAVLDRLTLEADLSRDAFVECMDLILGDPDGPYGRVLSRLTVPRGPTEITPVKLRQGANTPESIGIIDRQASEEYRALLNRLEPFDEVSTGKAALFIIDPQASFTEGVWMRSIGSAEVMPIRQAFHHCAHVVGAMRGRMEILFSRCPFPPGSYDWDQQIATVLDVRQPYFIKPGNSILWPPTNGFRNWVDGLLARGKDHLIFGGCTLNSCVRVSAVEVQHAFAELGLKTVVDLSLCGARRGNHVRSPEFGGLSSVEAAVREMVSAGVRVVPRLSWP
jgi:nicotinamidase-related amidase